MSARVQRRVKSMALLALLDVQKMGNKRTKRTAAKPGEGSRTSEVHPHCDEGREQGVRRIHGGRHSGNCVCQCDSIHGSQIIDCKKRPEAALELHTKEDDTREERRREYAQEGFLYELGEVVDQWRVAPVRRAARRFHVSV